MRLIESLTGHDSVTAGRRRGAQHVPACVQAGGWRRGGDPAQHRVRAVARSLRRHVRPAPRSQGLGTRSHMPCSIASSRRCHRVHQSYPCPCTGFGGETPSCVRRASVLLYICTRWRILDSDASAGSSTECDRFVTIRTLCVGAGPASRSRCAGSWSVAAAPRKATRATWSSRTRSPPRPRAGGRAADAAVCHCLP